MPRLPGPADKVAEAKKKPYKPKVSLTAPKKEVVGKPATSKVVKVKAGDTLASIAKKQGVTVAAIHKANPKFKSVARYQGGSKIFRGTTVNINKGT